MARFTATHGVHLADLDIQFVFDAEATGQNQAKVYAADVSPANAKKLLALPKEQLEAYGIAAVDDKADSE